MLKRSSVSQGVRRTASVRCSCFTDAFALTAVDFESCLAAFPEMYPAMREVALARRKVTRKRLSDHLHAGPASPGSQTILLAKMSSFKPSNTMLKRMANLNSVAPQPRPHESSPSLFSRGVDAAASTLYTYSPAALRNSARSRSGGGSASPRSTRGDGSGCSPRMGFRRSHGRCASDAPADFELSPSGPTESIDPPGCVTSSLPPSFHGESDRHSSPLAHRSPSPL
eukprot:4612023-Prymnesium_polylepis.1